MYKPLTPVAFGVALCSTGDLDPVYTYAMALPLWQRRRFVFAYLMFYHAGIATLLSVCENADEFARAFTAICAQTGGARGSERRHFRGKHTTPVVRYVANSALRVSDLSDVMVARNFEDAYNAALKFPTSGRWLSFKMADMFERCGLVFWDDDVSPRTWTDVDSCGKYWYDPPLQGLQLMVDGIYPESGPRWEPRHYAYRDQLLADMIAQGAVPCGIQNRPLNLQEVETVCCKYKSHAAGRYPVGKDIEHLYNQLNTHWLEKEPTFWYFGADCGYANRVLDAHRKIAKTAINLHARTTDDHSN